MTDNEVFDFFLIEEGLYVLKRDVKNCSADRRYYGLFDSIVVWREGTLIQVIRKEGKLPILRCLWSPCFLGGDLVCGGDNAGQWKPLLDAMDNPPQNMRTLMSILKSKGIDFNAEELLAMLMHTNKVRYQDLLELATKFSKFSEFDPNEWRMEQGLMPLFSE